MSSPWAKLTEDEQKNIAATEAEYNGMCPLDRQVILNALRANATVSQKKGIEELLREQGVTVDAAVVRKMQLRFSSAVMSAISQQNGILALDAYTSTELLPGTSTQAAWNKDGLVVCDEVVPMNPHLVTCLKNGVPGIIKGLTEAEATRQKAALAAGVQFLPVHHLAPFQVLEEKAHTSILMPFYPMVLRSVPNFEFPVAKLWKEMQVALTYLHELGFAHCDVKPENIFIDNDGKYLLGDHGSLAVFGSMSQSTPAYLPSELRSEAGTRQRASASLDWWMLALTLLEKCGVSAGGWKKEKVKEELTRIEVLKQLNVSVKLE